MDITIQKVTEENREEAIKLSGKDSQRDLVPSVAESLSKISEKPDGENVTYLPFAIYEGDTMVGFIMHAYEEETTNMYWINGFIIDQQFQGKGYGKAALTKMIHWIRDNFDHCSEIRLSVSKENESAYELYKNFGFVETGETVGKEDVLFLSVQTASD
ncbi:GNAT family N-acetyltransferase [Jeotgalibacillus sp. S-D1]|uniref:GNAT family N-acetyltransferase n=1 Tax=Jeotgalibacillus sp. S-D1 TaxID=2552189 RepID=UPI001059EE4D|nr:GNAT family N-acetyltransferase [Jeotgalibacillus sp. S-D1]TDL34213.1 GNAT family N-acetyltransferase [Jeotgalibacillus sp. S-D1]